MIKKVENAFEWFERGYRNYGKDQALRFLERKLSRLLEFAEGMPLHSDLIWQKVNLTQKGELTEKVNLVIENLFELCTRAEQTALRGRKG